ncbi:MAG: restriction endonuclease subunit S, partial [Selenomonadaceae bacterium]|nr:restriction endonuclease subunit S [Selenomonadaceae bacterium]
TSFIIHTKINFEDEWLHSFYYFNDEIPAETDFEKTMADYLTFEFNMSVHGRGYLFDDEKKNSSITEFLPPLEKKSWKDFLIKDIFKTIKKSSQVPTGSYVTKGNLIFGKTPRITVTSQNNGIYDFYSSEDENYRLQENFISVSFLGDCFFHKYTASLDMKVHCLKLLNFELNEYVALFLIQTLKQMTKNFNYGDQLSSTDIVDKKILLPVDNSGAPDYIFMENFMRRIEEKLLQLYREFINRDLENNFIVPADKKVWKEFCINEIFIIKSGVRLTKNDMHAGKIPFIGALDNNNGLVDFISNKNSSLDKNVLGVNYDGNGMVQSFYHQYEAIFSDSVKRFHLRNCDDNKYIFLFIKNSILKQKIKFQYGYKFNASRMERQKILLPVDDSGAPDWAYMENYMRRQENLLLKKYLEKKI